MGNCEYRGTSVETRRLEAEKCRDFQESELSLHSVGPGVRTLVIRLGVRCFYPMSHLIWPEKTNLNNSSSPIGPLGCSFYLPISLKEAEKSRHPNVPEFCMLDSYPRSCLLTHSSSAAKDRSPTCLDEAMG